MEALRSPNRVVDISSPILAEDSTCENPALSLVAVLDQLGENAKANDYLVGLLLVLSAESGFRVSSYLSDAAYYAQSLVKDPSNTYEITKIRKLFSMFLCLNPKVSTESADNSKVANSISEPANDFAESIDQSSFSASNISKSDQNTRIVYIPRNWKSSLTGIYEIPLVLSNSKKVPSKLIVIPWDDKMILYMFPCIRQKKIYKLIVKTLDYVNPNSLELYDRYINLKEISHRFKDILATPTRTNILSSLDLMSPSLQGLPVELQYKIIEKMSGIAVMCLAQCSRNLSQLCSKPQIWHRLFFKDLIYSEILQMENIPEILLEDARERYIEGLQHEIELRRRICKDNSLGESLVESRISIIEKFKRRSGQEVCKHLHPKCVDHTCVDFKNNTTYQIWKNRNCPKEYHEQEEFHEQEDSLSYSTASISPLGEPSNYSYDYNDCFGIRHSSRRRHSGTHFCTGNRCYF